MDREDYVYLSRAKGVSKFSSDPGTKIGAILVRDNQITGIGFNSMAPGIDKSEMNDREFKIAAVIHAEENAFIIEEQRWLSYPGTMYVWGIQSCAHCVAICLAHNVKRFISVRVREDREEWNKSEKYARRQCEAVGAQYDSYTIFEFEKAEETYAGKNQK